MTTGHPTEKVTCYRDDCGAVDSHLTPSVGQMRVLQVLGSPLKEQQRRIDGATFWLSGSPRKREHGRETIGRPMSGNATHNRSPLEMPASLTLAGVQQQQERCSRRMLDTPDGCKVSYQPC